ncbi:MAG: 2-oxo-tetronate isomerase [Alphaproteobacteria bacterium]
MPRLAANLSMLFNEHDFLDRFAAAAKAGFRGVEFLFPYAWPAEQLAERLHENGLSQALFNMPPGDWDAGDRGMGCIAERHGEFQDGVEQAIAYAGALGCPTIHAMAGIAPVGVAREALTETYVENLKFAAARCAEAGLTVVIEPINSRDMPGFFLNTSAQGLDILARVGVANAKLQYDIYHMQVMEGDLAPTIAEALPMIGHMQLADTPGRHEPGSGEINYQFLLPEIDRLGYSGWIGCEYRPAGETVAGLGWAKRWLQ